MALRMMFVMVLMLEFIVKLVFWLIFHLVLSISDSNTEEFFESFSRNAILKCLDLSQNRSGEKEK